MKIAVDKKPDEELKEIKKLLRRYFRIKSYSTYATRCYKEDIEDMEKELRKRSKK